MTVKTPIGFYGKLPIVGDFVTHDLPDNFISIWDKWLQHSIAVSHEILGKNWLNHYLTSPIWRFLLSADVCGNKAIAGIMMPSVDRVGRYYPLILITPIECFMPFPFMFSKNNFWFERLENIALLALEQNMDLKTFEHLIQAMPEFSESIQAVSLPVTFTKTQFFIPKVNIIQVNEAFNTANTELLIGVLPKYSLWYHSNLETHVSSLLIYADLPPLDHFVNLLVNYTDENITKVELDLSKFNSNTTSNATMKIEASHNANLDDTVIPQYIHAQWQSWAITDIGKHRRCNEDALLNKPEAHLWAVADGMGGHAAGDIASQLIVEMLDKLTFIKPLDAYVKTIEVCLQNANTKLRQLATQKYANRLVGSTIMVLACDENHCTFLWAGDSRLYRFRNNQLEQLSQDHCIANEQQTSQWSLKNSNVITRAVGADDYLDLDIATTKLMENDIFLLCTDGLDKDISFKEIEFIMQTNECQHIASNLINKALTRNSKDNITVIVVTFQKNKV